MDITKRNQDIVARRVKFESLEAIGTRYKLTRERVRQIFDRIATQGQKDAVAAKVMAARTPAPKPPRPPVMPFRIVFSIPGGRAESDHLRDLLQQWLDGKLKVPPRTEWRVKEALGVKWIYVTAAMRDKINRKCEKIGMSRSAVARALLAMEQEPA